jgi:uncharacterized membrane-anchored protein YitT (DUF2179 family)
MEGLILNKRNELISRVLFTLAGGLLAAISINAFIIPHTLLSGGVSGVAIIVQYIAGIPSGYLILALNIPIFLYGMKEIDKDFILYSLVGMISMSLFLILTENISSILRVNDILLSSIVGGALGGVGMGIVFNQRASLGGIDIIAVALKRKTGINISTLSFAMNMVVVLIGATISSVEVALYTLISMYLTSAFMERVIAGLDRKKLCFIVTEKEKDVSEAIMKELGRGITFFYGEGAYTGDRKRVIYCIVPLKQLVRTKKIASDIDPTAFITVVDASEVQGSGFRKVSF